MSEGKVSRLRNRRFEQGSGTFKTFFSLAFLAAVVFVGIKTLPPYVDNYQLQDHIQQLAMQVAVRTRPITPDQVRADVVAFADDHGIPVVADNVKVMVSQHVKISVDYKVPVDLKVYTLMLHFTPSAENRTL
jgi:cell division protein FtsL